MRWRLLRGHGTGRHGARRRGRHGAHRRRRGRGSGSGSDARRGAERHLLVDVVAAPGALVVEELVDDVRPGGRRTRRGPGLLLGRVGGYEVVGQALEGRELGKREGPGVLRGRRGGGAGGLGGIELPRPIGRVRHDEGGGGQARRPAAAAEARGCSARGKAGELPLQAGQDVILLVGRSALLLLSLLPRRRRVDVG